MADDIKVQPSVGAADPYVATDEVAGRHYQIVKLAIGADGTATLIGADGLPISAAALPLPTGASTEATLAALKSVVDSLLTSAQAIEVAAEAINGKTTAVNTGAIAGTVALDAPTLEALESINANTGGLTDAELRASALQVTDVTPAPTVTITSVQTDASGTAWTAFATAACNSIDIVNATNVDIEYRRNGAGTGMPIPARSSRSVLGITDADEVSVRRIDQLTTQVTIHAEVFA